MCVCNCNKYCQLCFHILFFYSFVCFSEFLWIARICTILLTPSRLFTRLKIANYFLAHWQLKHVIREQIKFERSKIKTNTNEMKWNAMNLSFQLSLLPINVIVYARCTVCNFMQTENFTLNHLVYPNVLADIIMICVCVCAHSKCASPYSNEELQHT